MAGYSGVDDGFRCGWVVWCGLGELIYLVSGVVASVGRGSVGFEFAAGVPALECFDCGS